MNLVGDVDGKIGIIVVIIFISIFILMNIISTSTYVVFILNLFKAFHQLKIIYTASISSMNKHADVKLLFYQTK